MPDRKGGARRLWDRLVGLLDQSQHRKTYYLTLNTIMGAGVGVLFWLLLARLFGLPPSEIGVGYAVISLGTIVGVLGKGGFDTALLRNVPQAGRRDGFRLFLFSAGLGGGIALALTAGLAFTAGLLGALPELGPLGWALVGLIGLFLVVTWLQDAWFLAEEHARHTFHRNVVFSAGRLMLPLPLILLAFPAPVAMTWGMALLFSAVVAFMIRVEGPMRPDRRIPRRVFMQSAWRNMTGGAAEFLPGMVLSPIVLAVSGADAAAYFGIAWTGAMILFLVSAAVGRSALTEMVGGDAQTTAIAVRRGARQLVWLVAPAAVVGVLLAPWLLGIFGPGYAEQGAPLFVILAASIVFVAPAYLYIGVLRAHERPVVLVLFPAAMVALLFVLAPIMGSMFGPAGVAWAWLAANAPFGAFAAWRLAQAVQGKGPLTEPHGGPVLAGTGSRVRARPKRSG